MKPALSLVAFTVFSGAGLGLIVWLVLGRIFGAGLSESGFHAACLLAFTLLALGLVSSSLHLANRRNAWRAFARWRTSWLAREAIAALAIWPLGALWWFGIQTQSPAIELTAGLLVVACAVLTVWCTAMIYACLRTVPRWHSWHTRVSYPLFAAVSGGLLWWALLATTHADRLVALDRVRGVLTIALALAAALKYAHWKAFAGRRAGAIDTAQALAVQGRARLFEAGHTGPTFLTREFGFHLDPRRALLLRWLALCMAFALPAMLIGWPTHSGATALAWIAAVLSLAGLLVERWLFFAEAEHVVRLYHGAPHV